MLIHTCAVEHDSTKSSALSMLDRATSGCGNPSQKLMYLKQASSRAPSPDSVPKGAVFVIASLNVLTGCETEIAAFPGLPKAAKVLVIHEYSYLDWRPAKYINLHIALPRRTAHC